MPGIKKSSGSQKYNKVNQQRKFHLLMLFHHHHIPLREAAAQAGVNYLTAKTIIFFNKKDHKSYQFDLRPNPAMLHAKETASYTSIRRKTTPEYPDSVPAPTVQVICSTGSAGVKEQKETEPENQGPNLLIKREQEERQYPLCENPKESLLGTIQSNLESFPQKYFSKSELKLGGISSNLVQRFEIVTSRLLEELQEIKRQLPVKDTRSGNEQ